MAPRTRLLVLLASALCLGWLGACANIRSAPVHSSGTPVNPWSDPGGTDMPGSSLTGSQPQSR